MAYTQLNLSERYRIGAMLEMHLSIDVIANAVKRSPTTIRAEVRRGRHGQSGVYCPESAQRSARARKANNAGRLNNTVWLEVQRQLDGQWSPEQITGRLQACGDAEIRVSHQSIYNWIARDKSAGGQWFRKLRCAKPYRRRNTKETRGKIQNRRDITERPEIVEERGRIGDWEIDLVVGADHKGMLITANERLSGLSLQKWVPNKTSEKVAVGVIHLLAPFKAFVHTITADNGLEFAKHEFMASALEADFYFAKPYASWQRGSNENTNGLIRQYFPKGRRLDQVNEYEVMYCVNQLNNRPRKRHGYKTPIEVFTSKTGVTYSRSHGFSMRNLN
jgi:transposase, IS30 family